MSLRPSYPIRTRRLQLRPLRVDDVAALLAYHASAEVHRFLPMGPMDEATVAARVTTGPWSRSTLEEEGHALVLGVERGETAELIGDVMLRWTSQLHQSGEIGYVFHPEHAGHGFATEAMGAVLDLAFASPMFHRLVARVDARNHRSLAVAERLGMRREAHLVQSWWQDGEWSDEIDLGILRSEWTVGR